jgi:hypothetical protein
LSLANITKEDEDKEVQPVLPTVFGKPTKKVSFVERKENRKGKESQISVSASNTTA